MTSSKVIYGTIQLAMLTVGKLVRIGPKEVLISDPEAIKVIYTLRSGFTKVPIPTPLLMIVLVLYSF
jgi:hypothetical protein